MILVFDLDDTLYPEASFVRSGFRAVAEFLSPQLNAPSDDLARRMDELLAAHGRGDTFNRLLAEYTLGDDRLASQCVRVYRNHAPRIELWPGVRTMLEELQSRPLYLVTDGDPDVQQRKIQALDIDGLFRRSFRTWSLGPDAAKPSLTCFELIRDAEGCEWADLVYVGDDPAKDFVGLNAVGATTVRVHSGRFADTEAAPGFDARLHAGSVVEVPLLLGL